MSFLWGYRLTFAALLAGSLSAHAQTTTPGKPDSLSTRMARRNVLSIHSFAAGPSGLGLGLGYERVLTPHLSVSARATGFRSYYLAPEETYAKVLEAGPSLRWYFAGKAPNGFYVEGGLVGRYTHASYPQRSISTLRVSPEVGVGYQLAFGRSRRFIGDVGLRFQTTRQATVPGMPPQTGFLAAPTLRLGFTF